MSKEAYERALERLNEINPKEKDREGVLAGLFIDEMSSKTPVSQSTSEQATGFEQLADQLGTTEENLTQVVDVDEDSVFILKQPEDSQKGKIEKLGLVYLAVQRIYHSKGKCETSELTEFMKDQGIYTSAMSRYLKNYENFIRMEKEGGGDDTSKYKITRPGLQHVGEVIDEIAEE